MLAQNKYSRVMALSVALSGILCGGDKRGEALDADLRAASESGGLALAEGTGRGLVIYPFNAAGQERQLECQFLSSKFDSPGLRMVGWGYATQHSGMRTAPSILVCDHNGNPLREVHDLKDVTAVAVAPDGKKLAAVGQHTRTAFRGLLILSLEPSTDPPFAVATEEKDFARQIASSPDSSQLVFSVGGEVRLFSVGTRTTTLLATGREPSWSPDGFWITFLSPSSHLVLYNVRSRLTAPFPQRYKSLSTAVWAPNSRWFAIAEDRNYHLKNKNCYSNAPLVIYRIQDLAHFDALDLCGLKPELFGWISNWKEWGGWGCSR
jgi:WD40-like Beta Propeller Repeat